MDSMKTPGKLQELSLEFTWTPDGVHKDAWLSVTISGRPSAKRNKVILKQEHWMTNGAQQLIKAFRFRHHMVSKLDLSLI